MVGEGLHGGIQVGKSERLGRKQPKTDPTPPSLHTHLAEIQPENKQGQETPVIAYTFLMCQKKRAITGDEEGEKKKNPCRVYFFHLNCKHLFGCKANRTFILLARFGLIMSTPRRRRVGRRCRFRGFGEAARTGPRPEALRGASIAPAERAGPPAITRLVPRWEGTRRGRAA